MKQEIVPILLILLIIAIFMFYYFRYVRMSLGMGSAPGTGMGIMEGLENRSLAMINDPKAYAEELKIQVDQLKSAMNISTHRTDYEDIIIHLDDLISHSMLKAATVIKMDHDKPDKAAINMGVLNKLNKSKSTLNDLMGWLDKQ